jgi:hypothetical protein
MGRMIREMATAIADAQWDLDKSSMTVAELMSGQRVLRDLDTGEMVNPHDDGSPRILDSRVYFGYTYVPVRDQQSGEIKEGEWERVPNKVSMMELGFTPNFYQFVDTIIEVKIAIKITGSTERLNQSSDERKTTEHVDQNRYDYRYSGSGYYGYGWGRGYYGFSGGSTWANTKTRRDTVQTTQVDASYSSKYSYSVEGASLLRTKLSPVPPPAILLERIHEVMDQERDFQERITNGEIKKLNDQAVETNDHGELVTT